MKSTEKESIYDNLETMSISQILKNINTEDKSVPTIIGEHLAEIEALIEVVVERLNSGGRLFYIGAGTSGRLGVVDASECPPTFGVDHGMVVGIISGGDEAIRKAVEFAEDDRDQGWEDLADHAINTKDFVIGIAASGSTPYVVGALARCQQNGISTGCIVCNNDSAVAKKSDFPIEIIVGPEFVTGSTRMKAGTAQKLVLNMISTGAMIKTGRVRGNKMIDMQLSNDKLLERGARMIMEETSLDMAEAKQMLEKHGSVRVAIDTYNQNHKK